MHEHAVAASSHGHFAGGEGAMPHLRLHVQVDNLMAVGLLLAVVWAVLVATPPKDIHAFLLVSNGGMKIPIGRRHTERLHIAPFHCVQIERMHIAAELIDLVHKSPEDVHAMANDARRVAIPSARQAAADRRTSPARRLRIEAIEHIAEMLIIAAAPDVDALLVGDNSVAIALERHQRILQRIPIRIALLRHQSPAQRVHVQHMDIDRLIEAIIVAGAIAPKAIDEVPNANGGMIHPLRPAVQMHRPQHATTVASSLMMRIDGLVKQLNFQIDQ